MAKKYTADELIKKLRYRFLEEKYVVFEQVASGTGRYASSWIDAIVFSLWPSDGLTRSAFEVKVDRSDFLHEIQNPNKNAWARAACHEFWYVAPKGVIKEEELPAGCGWMRPHGPTLAVVRNCVRNEAAVLDDVLLASLARSMAKEKRRFMENTTQEVLANNDKHQEALAYMRAVERFLTKRGSYMPYREDKVEEAVFEVLEKASAGDEVLETQRHIDNSLSRFQDRILNLHEQFVILAFVALNECDETGRNIISSWGGDNGYSIALERAMKAKKDSNEAQHKRQYASIVEQAKRLLDV